MAYKNGIDENGHPFSYKDDNALFSDLPADQQAKAREWVKTYCKPMKTVNYRHSSYGLKHILDRCTGVYMTNNQFKDLMLQCGFAPDREHVQNWNFRIMERPLKLADMVSHYWPGK